MLITFGKHKGLDTSDPDIDISYLTWIEEQEWVSSALRRDVRQELERRLGDRPGMGKVVRKGR